MDKNSEDLDKKAKEKLSYLSPYMLAKEGDIYGIVVWIPQIGEITIYNPESPNNRIGELFQVTPKNAPEFWEYFNAFVRKAKKNFISPGLRFKVLKRDGFRCQYCGRSAKDGAVLEVDHIIPKSKGGTNDMDNLITACRECNRGKRDKLLDDDEI